MARTNRMLVAVLATAMWGGTGCGGSCPSADATGESGAANAGAGGETPGVATVAHQGPTAHETPEHNLEFDDHVVGASPSDAAPERLTPEIIEHIVQGQIPDVHQCYENALHASAAITGRVVVLMHISATGNVVSSEVGENTTGSDGLAECISEHVQHWHFPEAAHDISVRYPFLLQPTTAAATAPAT
ncbi:MAG: AgmX/PglI C-terminal domain-containing protein [Myxococcota bacterium]|nr:AgmX/PglI C-terminal domain-containing protein [Myxococcota bacterium]